jgi:hypothetical protein
VVGSPACRLLDEITADSRFGNDRKKSKGNGKDKGKRNGKGKYKSKCNRGSFGCATLRSR